MPLNNMAYVAGENLLPCRFVKRDTSNPNAVVYATNGDDAIVGITFSGTRDAPIPLNTSNLLAETGDPVRVYGPGDRCEVVLGENITEANLNLTAGTAGVGMTPEPADFIGAIAERAASSGEKVWVQVVQFEMA